jgi:ankyrin repeat protein
VHYLLDVGANVFKSDKKSGRTALHWAARMGHLSLVQLFVQKFAFPVDQQVSTAGLLSSSTLRP